MRDYSKIEEQQSEEVVAESPNVVWRSAQLESNGGPILAHNHATALAAYICEMCKMNQIIQ